MRSIKKSIVPLWICAMFLTMPSLQVTAGLRCDPIGEEIKDNDFFYINHGNYIEITCAATGAGDVLIIPEEINDLPVTKITEYAFANSYFSQVIWSSKIPVIPEGAFKGCSNLYTLILPGSVVEIEQGAFSECDKFGDLFFDGNAAAWDEVRINADNMGLDNANIHLEYAWTDETAVFTEGEDNWSFTNHDVGQYLLSSAFVDAITANYSQAYQEKVRRWSEQLKSEYLGACSGLAMISFLVSHGVLAPSDIYPGAETLYDIPLCPEVIEMITYYFNMSNKDGLILAATGEKAFYQNFNIFLENMRNGIPAYFTYYADGGRHAVNVYGIEKGEWLYQGKTYTGRFLSYDNNRLACTDEVCIYFTEDFDALYVPYMGCEVYFTGYITEPWYYTPYSLNMGMDYVSTYTSGDINTDNIVDAADAAAILTAAAATGSGNDTCLNNGRKSAADVNNDGTFNAIDATKILEYSAYSGSGGVLTFEQYLPK